MLRRSRTGGAYSDNVVCGSRLTSCNSYPVLVSSVCTTRGCNGNHYYPGALWDGTKQYLNNYEWFDNSIYNSSVDNLTMGECAGLLRRARSGGPFNLPVSTRNGTRCIVSHIFSGIPERIATIRGCNGNYIILGRHGMGPIEYYPVILLKNLRSIILP